MTRSGERPASSGVFHQTYLRAKGGMIFLPTGGTFVTSGWYRHECSKAAVATFHEPSAAKRDGSRGQRTPSQPPPAMLRAARGGADAGAVAGGGWRCLRHHRLRVKPSHG